MNITDIASLVFISVTANHLGLIKAIEEVFDRELPIINCCKCLSFWSVLTYATITSHDLIASLAVSFIASYGAIWLELLEGYIDILYQNIYDEIYSAED